MLRAKASARQGKCGDGPRAQEIEPLPEAPQYILTEQGVGYRLKAPD
jgi:hypothetical protein